MNFKKVVKSIMDDENLKSKLESLQSFEEVYKFFLSNGYKGTKQELRKNLFGKSGTTYEVPEKELDQVAGGASGKKALAACAGIMMMLGVAPIGLNNHSSAKTTSIDNALSMAKIGRKDEKNQSSKDFDADKAEKRLSYVFDHFHGQEAAKNQIMSFFKQYAQERETGLSAPRVLIFNGPRGTGKTLIAEELSSVLTSGPHMIQASDIWRSSGGDPAHMPYAFLYGGYGITKTYYNGNIKQENLISFLKKTEGSVRVVIIDGWDKIYGKDAKGNYPDTHPLDETIRNILSNRLMDYNGDSIDLNGVVFIFTGNESVASLQGLIKVDSKTGELVEAVTDENGNLVLDEYGDEVYSEPKTDSSRSQTLVSHDESLMQHLAGEICYFDAEDS